MIPEFKAYLIKQKKIVDVRKINYNTLEIGWIDDDFHDRVTSFDDIKFIQSTGLLDKNGTEIFEGHIVKHDSVPNPFISNAYYEIIQVRSGLWRMDNYRDSLVLAFSNQEVEVIGNKFEDPHLLEED